MPTPVLRSPGRVAGVSRRGRLLDVRCLAAGRERLAGQLRLRGMPRLREAAGVEQQVHARADYALEFSRDEQGRCRIALRLRARLALICQRCLEPMALDIERRSALGVVCSAGEARRLPADCEPVDADASGHIDLESLIEEEILLSMPIAPKHPEGCVPGDC